MKKSRFDDWKDVQDCNDCQHYWNNTCDAPTDGSKLRCNSFLATRKVNIQRQIKTLQDRNKSLTIGFFGLAGCMVVLILWHWFGG